VRQDEQRTGPANQRAVRRHNLGVVLRHVAEHGPRSRAAIAQETRLNKTTVSSLVGELIGFGLVRETELEQRGTVGRPPLPVELSGAGVAGLGLEIGVDFIAARADDLAGTERHSGRIDGDNRGRPVDAVLDDLARLARAALHELDGAGVLVAGAGVALPGLIDSDGCLLVAPNLGWHGVYVPDELRSRLGPLPFPVRAENEANLGALAELWQGAGRELRDFLYVSGEIGVGAGMIVGGELFRGARGFSGELGHVTVDPDGEPCACGNQGCVETRVALGALLRAAGVDEGEGGARAAGVGEGEGGARAAGVGEAKGGAGAAGVDEGAGVGELVARAAAGDRRALDALDEAGRWLGVGVASAANVINPRGVVLGGYFALLARWLVPGVQAELDARVLSSEHHTIGVYTSALGREAAVRGAAALALRRVYDDPAVVGELARGR
jgi:predicted NBD/HSP70 family sugar kinase